MSDLNLKVDSKVTVDGVARNAATGAVVLMADRTPVYVDGVESWDKTIDGKKISASGMLRRKSAGALVNDRGEYSHGVPGDRFVLEQPSWTVI